MSSTQRQLAGKVRDECIQAALSAYESASMSGLCGEGAFEAAVSAMRMLDVERLVREEGQSDPAAGGS